MALIWGAAEAVARKILEEERREHEAELARKDAIIASYKRALEIQKKATREAHNDFMVIFGALWKKRRELS